MKPSERKEEMFKIVDELIAKGVGINMAAQFVLEISEEDNEWMNAPMCKPKEPCEQACPVCGTPCTIEGKTTMHYKPKNARPELPSLERIEEVLESICKNKGCITCKESAKAILQLLEKKEKI